MSDLLGIVLEGLELKTHLCLISFDIVMTPEHVLRVTGFKRGKTSGKCQARKIANLVSSAVKSAGKACKQ